MQVKDIYEMTQKLRTREIDLEAIGFTVRSKKMRPNLEQEHPYETLNRRLGNKKVMAVKRQRKF